jgi:aspergillopepsin I
VLEGSSWQIKYGDGSGANGRVYLDKVAVGNLVVPNQAVEAAVSVSGTFTRDPNNDGLLGMAFSRLNTIKPKGQLTWFDNIKPKLASPVFTCSLKRQAVGSYDFGYLDKTKYKGDIIWSPVKGTRGFWDFQITGFSVNGKQVGGEINAIADTGYVGYAYSNFVLTSSRSSLWYLPAKFVEAYYDKANIPGAAKNPATKLWTVPCATKLPDIVLTIAGKKLTIPGINMNYQKAGTACFAGIQTAAANMPNIAGDVFLKNLFVAFEHETGKSPRLGFAQSA